MKHSSIRKPISILLSLLMVLSVFGGLAFSASAESSGTYDGFSWTLNDDGALTFTGSGYLGQDNAWYRKGEITSISATGAIEQIDRDAFFGNQNVTSYTVESTTDLKISQDAFFVYSGSKMETITITAPKITLTNNLYFNYDEPMELIFNGDVYVNPGAFSHICNLSVHFNGDLYLLIPAGYYVFSGPGANELQSWYNSRVEEQLSHPEHQEDYERELSEILAYADEQGCTYTKYEEETTELLNEETIGQVFGSTYVAAQPNCSANGTKAYYVGAGVWDDSVGDFVDTYYLYENGNYRLVTADDLVMAPTGHDYTDAEWTYADADQHVRYCTVCNEPEYEDHDVIVKGAGDATCVDEGYTGDEFCSVCGAKLSEGTIIPAKGHTTAIVGAKEATDTEDGYTGDEVCTVCGETIKAGEVIPATGSTTPDEPADEAGDCPLCGKTHDSKWVRIVHYVFYVIVSAFDAIFKK